MKLFWAAHTRASRIVWMLEEMGLSYERIVVPLSLAPTERDPALLAASPLGKVPALEDGDVRLWDSTSIALYLADRYPQPPAGQPLAPLPATPARGAYFHWTLFAAASIEPSMSENPDADPPVNRGQVGWGSLDSNLTLIERQLQKGGPWILGADFSAADIMVGSSMVFLRWFQMMPPGHSLLHEYADSCLARSAYQKALALEQPGPAAD